MQYLVEIIKALAWPITSIWLGYIFRNEIRLLLGRMSKFKYKDVEASFEKELAAAENSAEKIQSPVNSKSDISISHEEQLLRIAAISPRAAIVEAWTLIETAAMKAGLTSGSTIPRTNPKMIIEFLVQSEKLSPESINLIEKLRKIRNQASHLPDFAITQDEAERYLGLAVQSATIITSSIS